MLMQRNSKVSNTDFDGQLAGKTPEQIFEILQESNAVAAHNLLLGASCVRALDAKGFKYPESFPLTRLRFYRAIGSGRLLPETVERFSDSELMLRRLSGFSHEDQKALTAGPVAVVVRKGDATDVRMMDLDALRAAPNLLKQVLNRNAIRTKSEQIAWIEEQETKQRLKAAQENAPSLESRVREIKKGGKIVGYDVNGVSMMAADLMFYLSKCVT